MGLSHNVRNQIYANREIVIASAREDAETGKYAGVVIAGPEETGKMLVATFASYPLDSAARDDMRELIARAISSVEEELKKPQD